MRSYRQLTSEERYALSALRRQGYSIRAAARALERAPSTISREIRRNVDRKTGFTLVGKLDSRTVGDTNRRAIELIRRTDRRVRTITRGSRHRVPRLPRHRGSHRRALLLRYAVSLLGKRYLGEHERPATTVFPKTSKLGHGDSEGLRPRRPPAQSSAQEETRLPHACRML